MGYHALCDSTLCLAVYLEIHCEAAERDHQGVIDETDRDSNGFDSVSFSTSLLRLICALFLCLFLKPKWMSYFLKFDFLFSSIFLTVFLLCEVVRLGMNDVYLICLCSCQLN